MRSVFKIFAFCILLTLSACIQDYPIDFGLADRILVLNAELNPKDDTSSVLISLPKKPYEYGDYITPNDALVILFENDTVLDTLTFYNSYENLGVYRTTKKLKYGTNYSVTARYRDLPEVFSSQTIPEKISIEQLTIDKTIEEIDSLIDTISVQLTVNDNGKLNRYFAVLSYLEVEAWVKDSVDTNSSYLTTYLIGLKEFNDQVGFRDLDGYWAMNLSSQTIQFQIEVQSFGDFNSDNVQSMHLVMKVKEMTEDAYKYRLDYSKKGNDNYGEPSLVFSNIQNGLGIFSAVSTAQKKIQLK